MASRKVYLVDTENVGTAWKELLPQKNSKDMIILFYTEHSPGISYSDLNIIREYPSSFDMILCYPGKNGLDFQMVSYLGYLIKTAPKTEYIIVSNDTGFDSVVKFWCGRKTQVSRRSKSELTAPKEIEAEGEDVRIMLKEALSETYQTDEFLDKLYQMLCNYSVKQLQGLYFAMQKELGAQTGMEIYRQLKPQIKNIYKKIPK
ncbi:MAG: hypothetical protein HFG70_04250 [Hungatella sp.]|jgi:hypothetical protein|nr:hypothetical protein [Hungatella sp.]